MSGRAQYGKSKSGKIELLKELIKDIEEQRKLRESVPKSLCAPANEARNYYRGMNEGVYIALRVLNEGIGRIQNDSNSDKHESAAKEV